MDTKAIQRKITERFIQAIESLPYEQKEIAPKIGMQESHLAAMKKKDSIRSPRLYAINLLSKKYKISAEWIMTGRGKMNL